MYFLLKKKKLPLKETKVNKFHGSCLSVSILPTKPRDPIISFKLMRGLRYNNTYDPYMRCFVDERASAHSAFERRGALDFSTQISTSLKIIIIGDSVGMQLSQAMQEATVAIRENRQVVRFAYGTTESVHIASPVMGGGAIAGIRMTGMFTAKLMNNIGKFML